jgi:hypothetical protein
LQKISEVYSVAVASSRQVIVEFRHDLNARVNVIEQHAGLLRRKAPSALGNRVALKANNTTQAG